MELSKIISLLRKMPEPPKQAPGIAAVVEQILAQPILLPVRLFWDNLLVMRPWWPVLLPLLTWIGWRTYQRERARVVAAQASK